MKGRITWECNECGYLLFLPDHADPDYECPECDAWDWKEIKESRVD